MVHHPYCCIAASCCPHNAVLILSAGLSLRTVTTHAMTMGGLDNHSERQNKIYRGETPELGDGSPCQVAWQQQSIGIQRGERNCGWYPGSGSFLFASNAGRGVHRTSGECHSRFSVPETVVDLAYLRVPLRTSVQFC